MTERVTPRRRGSYGIDAPFMDAFLAGLVVLYLVLAIVTGRVVFWLVLPFLLAVEASYLYTTLRGKFVVWAVLLDRLKLRGDERVLGLGIVGVDAGEMLGEGMLAIEMAASARDVALTMHAHPTLTETLGEAAEAFYGHAIHQLPPRREQPVKA